VIVRALLGAASLAPPATGTPPPAWEAAAIADLRALSAWYASRGMQAGGCWPTQSRSTARQASGMRGTA
jgi:hypothetical protein